MDRYTEDNRRLWDAWTKIHESSKFYDLERFKTGEVRVRDYERDDVGDVRGKDLLHLQCHFGIDTLSWARLGANVTGIDFSPKAIALARRVTEELGLSARFVESSIQELRTNLSGEFDIVYTSRGAIWWLKDLNEWARTIAHFLRPGGIFYITEFHPILMTLSDGHERIEIKYPYFPQDDPQTFPVTSSYADPTKHKLDMVEHGWQHSIGEIVTSIADAGLRIDFLHEFDWVDYEYSKVVVEREPGKWGLRQDITGELPLMYSIRARK